MAKLIITPELRLTLQLLAEIEPDYVSDFILTLMEEINNELHADPSDMPDPVRAAYLFWIKRLNTIIDV